MSCVIVYGQQSSGWCWTGGHQGCMASQCSVPVINALLLFSLLYTSSSDGLIWSHGAAAQEKYMYWPLMLTDDHLWILASRSQNNIIWSVFICCALIQKPIVACNICELLNTGSWAPGDCRHMWICKHAPKTTQLCGRYTIFEPCKGCDNTH